ncbi:Proteasome subunit beta type-7-B [Camellia lanceoleosa]|uniref:Proteasome subunit beta type-7-B n=1 Tax=Camellia lanceoleosa TaxID=1840588 RepID=A0ACC0F893_9ERIC|nr:Proteasome subunit beta type-7-B [Camellia lanceoleosa]
MSRAAIDVPLKGGFSFSLCRRNEMLSKKGVQAPKFLKTGTAANTEAVTDMASSQLQLHRYHTGQESRVVMALTLLKSHLFSHQGYVQATLVLGGVEVTGPHLHTAYDAHYIWHLNGTTRHNA